MALIHLPQHRPKWRAFLDTVIFLGVSKNEANFLIEKLSLSRRILSMQLVNQVVTWLVSLFVSFAFILCILSALFVT